MSGRRPTNHLLILESRSRGHVAPVVGHVLVERMRDIAGESMPHVLWETVPHVPRETRSHVTRETRSHVALMHSHHGWWALVTVAMVATVTSETPPATPSIPLAPLLLFFSASVVVQRLLNSGGNL